MKKNIKKSFSRSNFIYAALDIGTSKIVCAVAKNNSNSGIDILGYDYKMTKFLKKGIIIDPVEIEKEIKFVVDEVSKKTQTKISNVIVNATITDSKSKFFEGITKVDKEKIDEFHIKSAINNSEIYNQELEYENIHQIIRYFLIDKEKKVIDPKNFFANELAVNIYQLLIKKNYYKSLENILFNLDLNIEKIVATPYASSLSSLIKDEKELGTICIDLGAGTSSVCIIENNKLIFAHSIPVGGNNITYDLASGLNTTLEGAERIKTLYGSVFSNPSDDHELIDVPVIGSEKNQFSQANRSKVNSYIKPRVEETLELIRQKLKEFSLHKKNYRRVVLTGGGALLEGIDQYAKIIFDSQVRVALPNQLENITGIKELNKPQFATVLGMLNYSQNNNDEMDHFFNEKKEKLKKNTIFSRFSDWLDQYI